jgi:hypothetical protein
MGIEQYVDAVLRSLVYVTQGGGELLRHRNSVAAAGAMDALGDAPGKKRPLLEIADILDQADGARLLVRLEQHDRKARFQD